MERKERTERVARQYCKTVHDPHPGTAVNMEEYSREHGGIQ